MSTAHDLIQNFRSDDPQIHELLRILESIDAGTDRLIARLSMAERALHKVGLHHCSLSGDWIKIPEEGMMLPTNGLPASWEELAKLVEMGKAAPGLTSSLCSVLMTQQRTIIETTLRDRLARPSGPSRLAWALGLRYPLKESQGAFLAWLKANHKLT